MLPSLLLFLFSSLLLSLGALDHDARFVPSHSGDQRRGRDATSNYPWNESAHPNPRGPPLDGGWWSQRAHINGMCAECARRDWFARRVANSNQPRYPRESRSARTRAIPHACDPDTCRSASSRLAKKVPFSRISSRSRTTASRCCGSSNRGLDKEVFCSMIRGKREEKERKRILSSCC